MISMVSRRATASTGTLVMILLGVVALAAAAASPAAAEAEPVPPPTPSLARPVPNIVLIQSDDHGWPFYGFMQRYLRRKLAAGELDIVGDPDGPGGNLGYDHPEVVLPEDHVSSTPTTDCGVDDSPCQSCASGSSRPCTPPIHRLITPALDGLAEAGSYFPIAHTASSLCAPSLASTMTGLYIRDYRRSGFKVTSPVIPEWLPGFDERALPLDPKTYLTMAAGKWQYGGVHGEEDSQGSKKHPFDRDMPRRNPEGGSGVRKVILPLHPEGPALERIKDFIACATCEDRTKCALPLDINAEPDSDRLASRANSDACAPQPFFIVLSPSIPHSNCLPNRFCPFFARDAGQCNEEPYKSYSTYCQYDPALDLDGSGTLEGDEYPTCERLEQVLQQIDANLQVEGRALEAASLGRNTEYLRWINVLDRAVDELMVHLRAKGLADETVILSNTDNGYAVSVNSKGHFTENGYRSPIVFYNPLDPPLPASCGPGLPGCQADLAHSIDILATIRDLAGTADVECPPPGVECADCCPLPGPDGRSRYSEGRSLHSAGPRSCEFPPGIDKKSRQRYRQCLIGGRQRSSQSIAPGERWYLLAEVEEPGDPSKLHLCKLYQYGCSARRLHDLRFDPNEKINLWYYGRPGEFCWDERHSLEKIFRHALIQRGWHSDCDS